VRKAQLIYRSIETGDIGAKEAALILSTTIPPCEGCTKLAWLVAQRGVRLFCREGWSSKASAAGWSPEELYELPPVWPRVDKCGAVLLIGDRRVVEVSECTITIETPSGGHLRFYWRTPC
jgi:hypothetical protein